MKVIVLNKKVWEKDIKNIFLGREKPWDKKLYENNFNFVLFISYKHN